MFDRTKAWYEDIANLGLGSAHQKKTNWVALRIVFDFKKSKILTEIMHRCFLVKTAMNSKCLNFCFLIRRPKMNLLMRNGWHLQQNVVGQQFPKQLQLYPWFLLFLEKIHTIHTILIFWHTHYLPKAEIIILNMITLWLLLFYSENCEKCRIGIRQTSFNRTAPSTDETFWLHPYHINFALVKMNKMMLCIRFLLHCLYDSIGHTQKNNFILYI